MSYLALSPLNLVKTRLQAYGGFPQAGFPGFRDSLQHYIKSVARVEGPRALWNGTMVSFLSLSAIGVYYSLYRMFCRGLYPLFGASSRLTSGLISHGRGFLQLPGSIGD